MTLATTLKPINAKLIPINVITNGFESINSHIEPAVFNNHVKTLVAVSVMLDTVTVLSITKNTPFYSFLVSNKQRVLVNSLFETPL